MGRLDYVLTDDDYIALARHEQVNGPGFAANLRQQRWIMTLVPPITFAILGLLTDSLQYLLPAGVLLGGVLWFGFPSLYDQLVSRQLHAVAKRGGLGRTGPVVLTWDQWRLHENFVGMGGYVDWTRFIRVDESAEHVFLLVGNADGVIVPKRAGAGVAALAAHARRFVGTAPR